jgi:elongation factor 1 alpha-like protein
MAAYFKDAPWLNIPENLRGEILIEPLYPPGRLLGGASSQGKVSKLAALAATRKKRGSETAKAKSQSSTASVALLDKLSASTSSFALNDQAQSSCEALRSERTGDDRSLTTQDQIYPTRNHKRQNSDLQPEIQQQEKNSRQLLAAQSRPQPLSIIAPIAPPSKFAKTLFGDSGFWQRTPLVASFQPYYRLPQAPKLTNFNEFAGPSPDDVVLKAQNSKGLYPTRQSLENY